MSDTRDSGGVVGGDAPGRTTPSARKRLSNRIVAGGAGALIGGVVVAGFVAGGFADASEPGAPAASSQAAATAGHGHHGKHGHHEGQAGPLRRVLHGEFTVAVPNNGTQLMDVQRGEVVSATPTAVTVKSRDGFTGTYGVDGNTKVRKDRKPSDIGQVKPGDRVVVLATKN